MAGEDPDEVECWEADQAALAAAGRSGGRHAGGAKRKPEPHSNDALRNPKFHKCNVFRNKRPIKTPEEKRISAPK